MSPFKSAVVVTPIPIPDALPLLGRTKLVQDLLQEADAGHTLLLYGPYGIGKTAVLTRVRELVRAAGRACAFVPHTTCLADVSRSLADEYLAGHAPALQRNLRSRLQRAVEDRPGVLVLDDVRSAGTALKGFLRALDGTGLGIVLTADVESERDHMALRAMHLAYREIEMPRLESRYMRHLLDHDLDRKYVPLDITESDLRALLSIAAGRPGILRSLVACVDSVRFWDGPRLRIELLRTEAVLITGRAYVHANV